MSKERGLVFSSVHSFSALLFLSPFKYTNRLNHKTIRYIETGLDTDNSNRMKQNILYKHHPFGQRHFVPDLPLPPFLLVNLPLFSCFFLVGDVSITFTPSAQQSTIYPYELFLMPK